MKKSKPGSVLTMAVGKIVRGRQFGGPARAMFGGHAEVAATAVLIATKKKAKKPKPKKAKGKKRSAAGGRRIPAVA